MLTELTDKQTGLKTPDPQGETEKRVQAAAPLSLLASLAQLDYQPETFKKHEQPALETRLASSLQALYPENLTLSNEVYLSHLTVLFRSYELLLFTSQLHVKLSFLLHLRVGSFEPNLRKPEPNMNQSCAAL